MYFSRLKYGGEVKETPFYGATVQVNEPVGPVGIACPEEFPLLGIRGSAPPAVRRSCRT